MINLDLLKERLALLSQLPEVEFIPFDSESILFSHQSPELFKRRVSLFRDSYLSKHIDLYHPGGFAPLPVQSSGVVGQGALS